MNTGFVLWVSIVVLYGIALIGQCCSRKIFFFGFYASRVVILICTAIIIHHMGQLMHKVRYSLRMMVYYNNAVDKHCLDNYTLFESNIEDDLKRAWRLCANSLSFSVLTIVGLSMEILFGVWCIQPIQLKPALLL